MIVTPKHTVCWGLPASPSGTITSTQAVVAAAEQASVVQTTKTAAACFWPVLPVSHCHPICICRGLLTRH